MGPFPLNVSKSLLELNWRYDASQERPLPCDSLETVRATQQILSMRVPFSASNTTDLEHASSLQCEQLQQI